jgi:hypothetical protein
VLRGREGQAEPVLAPALHPVEPIAANDDRQPRILWGDKAWTQEPLTSRFLLLVMATVMAPVMAMVTHAGSAAASGSRTPMSSTPLPARCRPLAARRSGPATARRWLPRSPPDSGWFLHGGGTPRPTRRRRAPTCQCRERHGAPLQLYDHVRFE